MWAVEILGNWPKVIEGACGEVQSPFWAFCLQGMYKNHGTGCGHLGRLGHCSWGRRMITFSFKEFPICLTLHIITNRKVTF